jgi:hypothetical protein
MRSGPLPVVFLLWAACVRDPVDTPCPDVEPGGLVFSEVRGAQGGSADTFGEWIEIYNASRGAVALGGLALTVRRLDGGAETRIMVRDDDMSLAAGAYAVLGRFARGHEPAHVTYGYVSDLDGNLLRAAELVLSSCGVVLDRVVYRTLPASGTLGFDGGRVPDASANDAESAWCVDARGTGGPGTPLMRNLECAL